MTEKEKEEHVEWMNEQLNRLRQEYLKGKEEQ